MIDTKKQIDLATTFLNEVHEHYDEVELDAILRATESAIHSLGLSELYEMWLNANDAGLQFRANDKGGIEPVPRKGV